MSEEQGGGKPSPLSYCDERPSEGPPLTPRGWARTCRRRETGPAPGRLPWEQRVEKSQLERRPQTAADGEVGDPATQTEQTADCKRGGVIVQQEMKVGDLPVRDRELAAGQERGEEHSEPHQPPLQVEQAPGPAESPELEFR